MAENDTSSPLVAEAGLDKIANERFRRLAKEGMELAHESKWDEALKCAYEILLEDPHALAGLLFGTHCLDNMRRWPEAYAMARLAVQQHPEESAAWTNMGRMADALYRYEDAVAAYRKAIALLARDDPALVVNWSNLGATMISGGKWEAAKLACQKALELNPESRKAKTNMGMAQLALGEWVAGWHNYSHNIGGMSRRLHQYNGEPRWDGSAGKKVILYGEQGLGDEISFASMVPDAAAVCKRLTLDVDGRLVNLFQRSFPTVKVYGDRWQSNLNWDEEDRTPDASIIMGQVGEFFRPAPESCPGTPYLKACPIRTKGWRDYFDTLGKPVIGIAWTGGMYWTGGMNRHWKLVDLLPWFKAIDAHWVCLQYKDAGREIEQFREERGIEIHQYPWATLTRDYDDTAALVAALDHVVSMQTAVIHLAGALGVPTWVCVMAANQWRYGASGDTMPWYRSVRLFRQRTMGDWAPTILEVAEKLKERYANVESSDRIRSERDSRRQRRGAQHHPPGKAAGSNLLHSLIATGQRPDAPQG